MSKWMDRYRGYTHPGLLSSWPCRGLWRRLCCSRDWHLWDEVLSSYGGDPDRRHYLSCDACDESVDMGCVNCE